MKSLYLRIYVTIVAALLLFAAVSGWFVQRHIDQERERVERLVGERAIERTQAWAELIQRSLPGTEAPVEEQAAALRDWAQRLRLPLALDDANGVRIAESELFQRRDGDTASRRIAARLEDGRTLWVLRPTLRLQQGGRGLFDGPGPGSPGAGARLGPPGPGAGPDVLQLVPPTWPRGLGLVALLAVLFVAVAAGAFPVVRRLTRRLEALKRGVETFGAGQLGHRVEVSGRDEVAAVAASFNDAAARVEALVRSHQSLLANASHELRSPLARMKMAVSMLDDAGPAQRERLKGEIGKNVAELDALVEEVLLASRLDAAQTPLAVEPVDLLALAAEEGARVDAAVDGPAIVLRGDERLLRRALRNLLENARRYGGGSEVSVVLARNPRGGADVRVCDRGPGVPEALRARIFEPFYRLPGHAEQAGGVGLGLSLVKQIAERHRGSVRCEAREGGGSCFVITLPG
jgi:signal transduction histidine kinase